jgi:hypothetical protein
MIFTRERNLHYAMKAHSTGSFRMLGVNFDFWPNSKAKWGTCGALTSILDDPKLLALASRLNGSLLRIGGSPADFLIYDVVEGACSAANLNKTQPPQRPSGGGKGYFCPIWDQVEGQCLTMGRWAAINTFALGAGLSIALDLNACWGRTDSKAEMDFTLIQGLFNITAAMAANGSSAVWSVAHVPCVRLLRRAQHPVVSVRWRKWCRVGQVAR